MSKQHMKKTIQNCDNYSPKEKPDIISMAENVKKKYEEQVTTCNTEIITINEEINIIGLSLQKSDLPLSFKSLGKLWHRYADNYRYSMENQIKPVMEYGVALNKVPDYITGCAVSQISALKEEFTSFTLPKGRYIKDTFGAETFEKLTTEAMQARNVKKWAKQNKVKIDNRFTVEAYPIDAIEGHAIEMYTLTPIKE